MDEIRNVNTECMHPDNQEITPECSAVIDPVWNCINAKICPDLTTQLQECIAKKDNCTNLFNQTQQCALSWWEKNFDVKKTIADLKRLQHMLLKCQDTVTKMAECNNIVDEKKQEDCAKLNEYYMFKCFGENFFKKEYEMLMDNLTQCLKAEGAIVEVCGREYRWGLNFNIYKPFQKDIDQPPDEIKLDVPALTLWLTVAPKLDFLMKKRKK